MLVQPRLEFILAVAHSRIIDVELTQSAPNTMPMATSATESVKPFVLSPVTDIDAKKECTNTFCQDGWLEKVFDRQDGAKPQKHKHNFIQRALESLTHHHSSKETSNGPVNDENSYREELQKYIKESSENLRYDEEDKPFGSSDEDTSDEDSDPMSISPRNAEIIDFSASIVSISSVDEYVVPPVEVPRSYRTQDRQGGVVVAGSRVLFTNWAFKRQMRHLGRLGPLPERGEMPSYEMPTEDDGVSVGMYSGKIVEL